MAAVVPSEIQKLPDGHRPSVLVVDDEPDLLDVIGRVVGDTMGCRVVSAPTLEAARRILASERVELLVTDVNLPDGDGTSLLPTLQKHQPSASAIVITGSPSVDGAITAFRGGAVDFVPKPFNVTQLTERVRAALDRQAKVVRDGQRMDRLRDAVKRLSASRKLISKKVDLLCNDLVTAYGELSKQLDGVRTQEGFRKYVSGAKDLEQLLCHSMDWLLRQMGYANVAVWLAAEDGEFQLGAYMKYTVPGEPMLADAMKRVLLPIAARDGFFRMPGDELADKLTPQEMQYLKGQDVMAVNCTYLGESLAAILFFRDARSPFTPEDAALLKSVSPIFAVSLAGVVKDAEGGDAQINESGGEADNNDEGGLAEPEDKSKSDADWWKRGEAPPF